MVTVFYFIFFFTLWLVAVLWPHPRGAKSTRHISISRLVMLYISLYFFWCYCDCHGQCAMFIFNHMRHFVSDIHARTHAQTESTEIAFVIYQPAAFIIDPNLNYMNMLRVSAQSISFAIHAPFLHCGSERLSPCARNALVLFVCLFQFLLRLYGAYVLFHFVIFFFLLLLTFSPHVCWLLVCGDAAVAYHFVRM